ncbi:hypothetical protein MSIMFB_05662 [Mycobacterium simulans]|uniref:Uncharacterized protein n=1 Tax=Mycobacterium simulans TaxID=627089 RepID=A0A7Z7ITD6_9MYCO|nr:hypothetical protein MSIMFB_05662 [Mycobacterium simulans]
MAALGAAAVPARQAVMVAPAGGYSATAVPVVSAGPALPPARSVETAAWAATAGYSALVGPVAPAATARQGSCRTYPGRQLETVARAATPRCGEAVEQAEPVASAAPAPQR